MAFGIITVRSESGEVATYELTNPVTSVGRLPGNDIVLNTTAVSRYHAQFAVADGQVYLVDLGAVNGTFVNDEQVEPNSRVALQSGDRITIGDVMLVYTTPEQPRRYEISLTPTTTTVQDPSLPFRLELDQPRQLVAPGARMQLVMLIENISQSELLLEISLSEIPHDWAKANWREVVVLPGEQTEVLISVLPPRSSETRPGRYPLIVRVALKDDPNQALEAVREVDVVGFYGLAVAARPSRQAGQFNIAVQNQGNVPMAIRLNARDTRGLLAYRFRPDRMLISPGATEQVVLRVAPRRSTTAKSGSVPFAIVAQEERKGGFQAPLLAHYDLASGGKALPVIAGGLGMMTLIASVVLAVVIIAAALLTNFAGVRDLITGGAAQTTEVPPTLVPVDTTVPTDIPAPTPNPTADKTPVTEPAQVSPAIINSFIADPPAAVYRPDGIVTLRWDVSGAASFDVKDESGQSILPTPFDPVRREMALNLNTLHLGLNTFVLTALDGSGNPSSPSAMMADVTVFAACMTATNAQLVEDAYAETPEPVDTPLPAEVIILGRVNDIRWMTDDMPYIQVAGSLATLGTPLGWLTYGVEGEGQDCTGSFRPADLPVIEAPQ